MGDRERVCFHAAGLTTSALEVNKPPRSYNLGAGTLILHVFEGKQGAGTLEELGAQL